MQCAKNVPDSIQFKTAKSSRKLLLPPWAVGNIYPGADLHHRGVLNQLHRARFHLKHTAMYTARDALIAAEI
jgi:hypothetical protein